MVELRGPHRFRQRAAVVDERDNLVRDRRDDVRPASGTSDQLNRPGRIEHDSWRHARQHPLARLDGIRRSLHQPHRIHRPDLRGKVVHLVVQQKLGAGHCERRPVTLIERRRDGDRVSVRVNHRKMRRVPRLFRCSRIRLA